MKIRSAVKGLMGAFAEVVKPPPDRSAAEWADQERHLPPGSPEPGPWRSSRTPFMIPFLEACSSPKYSTISYACGSQMGKTENILNIIGHRFTDGPFVPALLVFPTEKLSRSMSNDRFKKMIASTDILYQRLEKGHADKVSEKFFGGIRCGFAHAGSATELSSHPAGIVVIDEIDRMNNVSGEGDPYLLAKARTKNYTGSKVVITSTPTIEGASRIWALWEAGTMGRWSWGCLHCGEYFVPEFKLLKWEKDTEPEIAMHTARVVCPHCGSEHRTRDRNELNENGRYEYCVKSDSGGYENIGTEPPKNPSASFWSSGLASPWQSFEDIVYVVLTALESQDQGTIQGAINTYLGECYQIRGDAPKWELVKARRQDYRESELPFDVQVLTMGVDVQSDRLYYCTRGYGFKSESWLIEHGSIMGDTAEADVWARLQELVNTDIGQKKLSRVFVDSGYTPGKSRNKFVRPDNMIYLFCSRNAGICYPTKGRDMMEKPVKANRIDVTFSGKTHRNGMTLWLIDTDYFKRSLYSAIKRRVDSKFGWHVHDDIDDEYCKQITSEECITKESGKRQWIQTRRDNHFLDCEVLCDAAGLTLRVQDLKDVHAEREKKIAAKKEEIKAKDHQPFVNVQSGPFVRR